MEKTNSKMKKTLLIILFSFLSIVILGSAVLAQQGPGEGLTCPLDKEVPVGQIINQMTYTNDKILRQMIKIDAAAVRVLQTAKKLAELTNDCKTSNCQSDCQTIDIPSVCPSAPDPATNCSWGYNCRYSDKRLGDGTTPNTNCRDLPGGWLPVDPDKTYGIFRWQDVGHACNSSCPDPSFSPGNISKCSGYNCYYQGWEHSGKIIREAPYTKLSCNSLPSGVYDCINTKGCETANFSIFRYGTSNGPYCNILWPTTTNCGTCYNYDESDCATEFGTCATSVCRTGDACSGDACNFTDIDAQMDIISLWTKTISVSNQAIEDIFDKNVTELDLLGNVCKIPGLGIVCGLGNLFCNILGLGGCKTEIETILALFKKGVINTKDCWNDPADYVKIMSGEKSGKFLMSCEELSPGVFEKCYPNNFFCCR